MLLLPVGFCTPIDKRECDLNIEGVEGANVIMCYNICDRDCRLSVCRDERNFGGREKKSSEDWGSGRCLHSSFSSFFVFVLIFFQPRVPSLRIERLEQARYLLVVKYITDRISNSYQHWEYLFVTFVANIINDSAFSEV